MTPAPDVVVIGAGVVGAACADALAAAGLRVTVLGRWFAAGAATGAAMGHIVVMDDSPPQLALTAWSRAKWAEWAPEMPADCEDVRTGTLWIAASDGEWGALEEKRRAYAAAGVASDVLDAAALAREEPNLRPGLTGALRVPDDRVLYPPAAARWLLERAARRGATVVEDVVRRIAPGEVVVEGNRIFCGAIVNAAGISAPRLTPGLAVIPRKGHLLITERHPGFCRHQLVEVGYLASAHTMTAASTAFNLQPRATGQVLIGSSRQLVGLDASLDRRMLAEMLARAIAFVPALARLTALRAWTGFRPATPDSLPLIGEWPGAERLFIAAGHEGLGITTAPATAAIIAALITGAPPPIDAAPFAPARAMPAMEAA